MSGRIEIKIVIDPSLAKYFEDGRNKRHIDFSTAEEVTQLLTMVLNDSMYPVASSKTSEQEIHLSYRPRAFADPILQSGFSVFCDPSLAENLRNANEWRPEPLMQPYSLTSPRD